MTPPTSAFPLHTFDLQQLIGVLNARADVLPTRPEAIAGFLLRRGITGQRSSADCCPLRRYLTANLPADCRLYVDDHEISLLSNTGQLVHHLPLIGHITTFLRRFDAGDFPELIDQAA